LHIAQGNVSDLFTPLIAAEKTTSIKQSIFMKTFKQKQFIALMAAILGAMTPVGFAEAGVITNGLIGYWAGDNNANDSSPTGNNGSFAGSYVAGVDGQAAIPGTTYSGLSFSL
jgi:hypothetical protein